jgi:hypothetical protein
VVLPALCAFEKPVLQPFDEGCKLRSQAGLDGGCRHNRKVVKMATVPIPGLYTPVIHHNCVGNQLVGVCNRVLGVTPQPTLSGINKLMAMAEQLGSRLPKTGKQELGEFALAYTGAKRARYLDAAECVKANRLRARDARISMFVKPDRLNPIEKINPDPRPIQFRDPKYCVELAAYLKPIEPHLYALKYKYRLLSDIRLVGKGLNQFERATVLRKKWERFRRPVVISLDAARFDKHVHRELLIAEHKVYKMCNNDAFFRWLLRLQLENFCSSADGISYKTDGKRMSGDMNTALGNCIIMILMCLCTFLPLNKMFDLFDDGDDCLVICEADDLVAFQAAVAGMIEFGMVIKVEKIAYTFEEICWCQSQPVMTTKGWKFCRNPIKTMSCALVGQKWLYMNQKARSRYLLGLAECEMVLNKGIPVLHAFAEALRRNSHSTRAVYDTTSGEYFRYMRELKSIRSVDEVVPITLESRASFALAFGVPVHEQLMWESRLDAWQFPLIGDIEESCFYDVCSWTDKRVWTDCQVGF